MNKYVIALLFLLILYGCSKEIEPSILSFSDIEEQVINIFKEDNFTELTVIRNKYKKEKEEELNKLDQIIADEISKTFLSCEFLGETNYEESIEKNKIFEQEFLVFHQDSVDAFEKFLSDHYINCYQNFNYKNEQLIRIPERINNFNFRLNEDVFSKISETKEDVYKQLTKIVDNRDYDNFFGRTELELEILRDYKDAEKYEKFVEGMKKVLDPKAHFKSLRDYARSLEKAYGIPGFNGKADLEKIDPGFAKYHQLEGIWVGQTEHLRSSSSYTFLKFDNYEYFSDRSYGVFEIPKFDYGKDLYHVDGALTGFKEGNSNDYFDFRLSGNTLYYQGVTYYRSR